MQIITLYKYRRKDGGYTVSPNLPVSVSEYQNRYRIVADEGKGITNGTDIVTVIDVMTEDDCRLWQDCDLPEETEDPEEPEDIPEEVPAE